MSAARIKRDMHHVLHSSVAGSSYATECIFRLLRQLDVLRDCNRRLKFESFSDRAFEKDPTSGQFVLSSVGGFRAPGFSQIVQSLRLRHEGIQREKQKVGSSTKKMLDLAFVMPDFPPWATHRFLGEDGVMQSRLKINGDVLEVLEAFCEEVFTERVRELDEQYGVSRFFQDAGFRTHGELVLLDPLG
jgi:hypothetical protein